MTSSARSFLTLSFLLGALFTSGSALFCYRCSSQAADNDCSEVQECYPASAEYLASIADLYSFQDMKQAGSDLQPACYTVVSTVRGARSSTRACSVLGKFACRAFEQDVTSGGDTVNSCHVCDGDFCNDQSGFTANLQPLAAVNSNSAPPQTGNSPPPGSRVVGRPNTVLSTIQAAGVPTTPRGFLEVKESSGKTPEGSSDSCSTRVSFVLLVLASSVKYIVL